MMSSSGIYGGKQDMATKRLPKHLVAKAEADRAWYAEFSGPARPLWQEVLRISLSLADIGSSRADDATIQRQVHARLRARLMRLLGYYSPLGRPATAGSKTLDLMDREGLTVEEVAKREGVQVASVLRRFSRMR
jgi:hypothetical protein